MVSGEPAAARVLLLAACRAVLAGDVPAELAGAPGVRCVEMRQPRRATAPGASYAVEAVRALDASVEEAAVFTFAGPPGSALHLFDAGRDPASGRLVSAGFGRERSRRIHPFAVLLALQNQVAATLSLELGLRGPCCSTTDSAGAFADLLPNMWMAARERPVLAVLASAAKRAEHRSRGIFESGVDAVVEGAVALLFDAGGKLGSVAPDRGTLEGNGHPTAAGARWAPPDDSPSTALYAPVLEPGLSILLALTRGLDAARFEVHEPRRTTAFRWSRP
jgi:hypothetical protein